MAPFQQDKHNNLTKNRFHATPIHVIKNFRLN